MIQINQYNSSKFGGCIIFIYQKYTTNQSNTPPKFSNGDFNKTMEENPWRTRSILQYLYAYLARSYLLRKPKALFILHEFRLRDQKVDFIIEPYIRFEDQPGKQGTMFFSDPSGNAIEFKAFRDIKSELFAKWSYWSLGNRSKIK